MRKATSTETTETALYWAMFRQRPVTITYVRADGETTVRTIEVFDIAVTKSGNIIARAMDREMQSPRTWRLDRITHYTTHRGRYTVPAYEKKEVTA